MVIDQGCEFYCNPEVLNLVCWYKYKVFLTGSDSSNQNGTVEQGHQTFPTIVCALLFGSGLPV